jgi:hypothetical protein
MQGALLHPTACELRPQVTEQANSAISRPLALLTMHITMTINLHIDLFFARSHTHSLSDQDLFECHGTIAITNFPQLCNDAHTHSMPLMHHRTIAIMHFPQLCNDAHTHSMPLMHHRTSAIMHFPQLCNDVYTHSMPLMHHCERYCDHDTMNHN